MIQTILDDTDINSLQAPDLHKRLSLYINDLILNNFDGLVSVLYRTDVNEKNLRAMLRENTVLDAGGLIASLIIERQIQKIKSRHENRRENDIDEAESW